MESLLTGGSGATAYGCCPIIVAASVLIFLPMVIVTGTGRNPLTPVPDVNWWIVGVAAVGYLINNGVREETSKTFSKYCLFVMALFFSLLIMYIASLSFYVDTREISKVVLVLAGQLQYILLYLVVRFNYVERVVAYAQPRLKQVDPFSTDNNDFREHLYRGVAMLPFFLPLLIILIVFFSQSH